MGYKHMSHMYENPDLKFSELKDIFIKASEGELEGTEKTDGQNMHVSFSVVDGKAKASRNDSMLSGIYQIKGKGKVKLHEPGGVDAQGWAAKWAEHSSKPVRDAFVESFAVFETAAKSLSPEEQEEVFGDGVNYLIFYNCEVQDPRNMNTIRYDKKTITVHRVGHLYVDLSDGKPNDNINVDRNAYALQNSLRTMQKSIENEQFAFEINAIRQLKKLNDDTALKVALQETEKLIDDIGLSDSHTVGDYTVSRVLSSIRSYLSLPEDKEMILLKKILGHTGYNINVVKKDLSPQDRANVTQLYSDRRKIMSNAVKPLERIVHDFAVEMLKGFESAFVVNQNEEIQRLRKRVTEKIKEIESSKNQDDISVLMRNMEKLQKIENISTAAEGFVFDYNGKTYKLTGNFAPINQILGIGKYGSRGTAEKSIVGESDIEEQESKGKIVALIPGKFKPPHKGHLNMVKHYASVSDSVKILVSPLARKSSDGSVEFDAEDSIAVWNIYLRDSGLSNVEVMRSPKTSPVGAAFDFVENQFDKPEWAQPGDSIILGASTKGGDEARFAGNVQSHAREGVVVLDPMAYIFNPPEEMPFSATDFREDLASGNDIFRYLPDEVVQAGHEKEIIAILKDKQLEEKKSPSMDYLFSLVEEAILEREMTSSEKRKDTMLKKKMDKAGAKKDFIDRYGKEEGEKIYFATIRKRAMKKEEEELEEISGVAAGGPGSGVEGGGISKVKRKKTGLIREEDDIIEEILNFFFDGGIKNVNRN